MKSLERRRKLLVVLCRRRNDTIANLAHEFCVSERTIRRDIEYISRFEPIYTKTGRYGGGVYVEEGFDMDKVYIDESVQYILEKILDFVSRNKPIVFTSVDLDIIAKIVDTHKSAFKG